MSVMLPSPPFLHLILLLLLLSLLPTPSQSSKYDMPAAQEALTFLRSSGISEVGLRGKDNLVFLHSVLAASQTIALTRASLGMDISTYRLARTGWRAEGDVSSPEKVMALCARSSTCNSWTWYSTSVASPFGALDTMLNHVEGLDRNRSQLLLATDLPTQVAFLFEDVYVRREKGPTGSPWITGSNAVHVDECRKEGHTAEYCGRYYPGPGYTFSYSGPKSTQARISHTWWRVTNAQSCGWRPAVPTFSLKAVKVKLIDAGNEKVKLAATGTETVELHSPALPPSSTSAALISSGAHTSSKGALNAIDGNTKYTFWRPQAATPKKGEV